MLNLFPAPQWAIKRPPNLNSKAAIEPEFMANFSYLLRLYLSSNQQLFPHKFNLSFDKLNLSPTNPGFLPTHPHFLPANRYPSSVHLNILPTNSYFLQPITILSYFNPASNLNSPDQVMSIHHQLLLFSQGSKSPIQLLISTPFIIITWTEIRSEYAYLMSPTNFPMYAEFPTLADRGSTYLPTPNFLIFSKLLQFSISPIQLFILTLMQIRWECAASTSSTNF